MGDALFGIHYVANGGKHARLGMAVSVRTAGDAVRRNGIRRVIRESFRLNQHTLPAADVFVTARNATRNAPNAELFASLQKLWRRVEPS